MFMIRMILGVFFFVGASLLQAASVVTTDSIPDENRSNFNGFESNPCPSPSSGNCPPIYTEDNIRVEQINGQGDDIWLTYFTPEGSLGWYPNGGDNGYTSITLEDGGPILDIGFLRGSGSNANILLFELWNSGVMVQSGSVPHQQVTEGTYLGFLGGGFDEVRIRDGANIVSFFDQSINALAIDAIELSSGNVVITGSVAPPQPVPGLSLLGLGILASLIGVLGFRRRRYI